MTQETRQEDTVERAEPLIENPAVENPAVESAFVESGDDSIPADILNRRICDFDLRIEGRPLEKIIDRFRAEMHARGITALEPRFYLTDEWGVPEGTVAIGIPFYLADEALLRVQGIRGGLVEGEGEEDILRYLRHEMGHVVNYAYRLYTSADWTRLFGPMSRPYTEEYRVVPFSTDYVRHLPGGYAQKHPDEDWAETFAIWMTPDSAWRELYADSPGAMAKLEYTDETLTALRDKVPDVTCTEIDYDAREIKATVQEYYESIELGTARIPRSLDGDLRFIFARRGDVRTAQQVQEAMQRAQDAARAPDASSAEAPQGQATASDAKHLDSKPSEDKQASASPAVADGPARTQPDAPEAARVGDASLLLRRQRDALVATTYRWTGVSPELLWQLMDHLIGRARELKLDYRLSERDAILVDLSGFIHTLAMNYVYKGSFIAS